MGGGPFLSKLNSEMEYTNDNTIFKMKTLFLDGLCKLSYFLYVIDKNFIALIYTSEVLGVMYSAKESSGKWNVAVITLTQP